MSTAQPIFPEKKSKTQASVSRKRKSEADPIVPPKIKKPRKDLVFADSSTDDPDLATDECLVEITFPEPENLKKELEDIAMDIDEEFDFDIVGLGKLWDIYANVIDNASFTVYMVWFAEYCATHGFVPQVTITGTSSRVGALKDIPDFFIVNVKDDNDDDFVDPLCTCAGGGGDYVGDTAYPCSCFNFDDPIEPIEPAETAYSANTPAYETTYSPTPAYPAYPPPTSGGSPTWDSRCESPEYPSTFADATPYHPPSLVPEVPVPEQKFKPINTDDESDDESDADSCLKQIIPMSLYNNYQKHLDDVNKYSSCKLCLASKHAIDAIRIKGSHTYTGNCCAGCF